TGVCGGGSKRTRGQPRRRRKGEWLSLERWRYTMADSAKRSRHYHHVGGVREPAAEPATAAAADAARAADRDSLQFLLDGLSPSPTKKVKRSSGDLLDATGQDGKVLPELLSEHGGNTVTSTWPKPSARKQVLTFGASWDNKSGVDFLNKREEGSTITIAAGKGAGGGSGGSGGSRR
ncbi:unnamed protein product, partial [Scytosiphon promiscuus]